MINVSFLVLQMLHNIKSVVSIFELIKKLSNIAPNLEDENIKKELQQRI